MNRLTKFLIVLSCCLILLAFADKYRVNADIPPQFTFGEIVKIKGLPDSQKFKVVNYCQRFHEPNYLFDYDGNYHLLD